MDINEDFSNAFASPAKPKKPAAPSRPKPAKPSYSKPDLKTAPTWSSIEANPEFGALSDTDKAAAKEAYFDYWIAPHAGADADALRGEFLTPPAAPAPTGARTETIDGKMFTTVAPEPAAPQAQPKGTASKLLDRLADSYSRDLSPQLNPLISPEEAAERAGQFPNRASEPVLPGVQRSLMPVRPALRRVIEAQYNAATAEERLLMARAPEENANFNQRALASIARELNDRYGLRDKAAESPVMPPSLAAARQQIDPRGKPIDMGANEYLQPKADDPSALAGTARNLGAGLVKIPATAVKGVADITQMFTGGKVGGDLSEAMRVGMSATDRAIGTKEFNRQKQGFEQVMLDDTKGIGDMFAYLLENPAVLVDESITTIGSMFLPVAAGGAASKISKAAKLSDAARRKAVGATTLGTIAAQNAADTFTSTADQPLEQRYQGAATAAAVSLLFGIVTKGGAEGVIARRMIDDLQAGRIGLSRVKDFFKAVGNEALQESGEEAGGVLGESVASRTPPNMTSAGKRVTYAGTLGGVMGGGVNLLTGGEAGRQTPPAAPGAPGPQPPPAAQAPPAPTPTPAQPPQGPQAAPAAPGATQAPSQTGAPQAAPTGAQARPSDELVQYARRRLETLIDKSEGGYITVTDANGELTEEEIPGQDLTDSEKREFAALRSALDSNSWDDLQKLYAAAPPDQTPTATKEPADGTQASETQQAAPKGQEPGAREEEVGQEPKDPIDELGSLFGGEQQAGEQEQAAPDAFGDIAAAAAKTEALFSGEQQGGSQEQAPTSPTPPTEPPVTERELMDQRRKTTLITGDEKLDAEWDVVDADEVKASMKEGVNQPRDRQRAASNLQVAQISKNPDFERLSDTSKTMDYGAPTITKDGVIVGGNGRFEGVNIAYDGGTAAEYRKQLEENAARLGLDPAKVRGMKKPVLVRRIAQNADTRRLAIQSNQAAGLQMSDMEQAAVDAERMKSLDRILVDDSGNISMTANNIQVIKEALRDYTTNEQAGFIAADGSVAQSGIRRIRNAILFQAYGKSETLARLIESPNADLKNVGTALVRAATQLAKTRRLQDYDISSDITEAVETLSQLRTQGRSIEDFLAQIGMFGDSISAEAREILQFLNDNIRSARAITEFLQEYAATVEKADNPTAGMFGDAPLPGKLETLQQLRGKSNAENQQAGKQDDIFKQPDPPADERPGETGQEGGQRPEGEGGDARNNQATEGEGGGEEEIKAYNADLVSYKNSVDAGTFEIRPEKGGPPIGHIATTQTNKGIVSYYSVNFELNGRDAQKAIWMTEADGRYTIFNSDNKAVRYTARALRNVAENRLQENLSARDRKNAEKLLEWATGMMSKDHYAKDPTPDDDPINTPVGEALGTSPEETQEIGEAFKEAKAKEKEDSPHRLFERPESRVRVQDAVKIYNAEHGWMTLDQAKEQIRAWEKHAIAQAGKSPTNSNKVVLSLFDRTGAWSLPWEQAGYQVYRFDIQNDPEVGDVNNFSTEFFNDWFSSFEGMDVYAILAACPCTDFASSGARHFAAKDESGATVRSVELVRQTLATIEYFAPAVWALENPVGRIEKLTGLPPWRMSFDPNHFGDPYTKKTLLWGRFDADLPVAPVEPTEGSKMHSQYGGSSIKTKNARSVTPEGFAYSFFMANNAIDNPDLALIGKYDRLDIGALIEAADAGITVDDLASSDVDDAYYIDMNDKAAEAIIRNMTEARKSAADVNDIDKMLDDLLKEESEKTESAPPLPPPEPRSERAPRPPRAPRTERSAREAAASAAKNTAKGASNAIDALGKLFGGDGKLGSGLSFDEETYAKAKPAFIQAAKDFGAAAQDLKDVARAVVQSVKSKYGSVIADRMRPYMARFLADVRDGKINLRDTYEPPRGNDTQSDSQDDSDEESDDETTVPNEPGRNQRRPRRSGGGAGGGRSRSPRGSRVPGDRASASGERGDQPVHQQDGRFDVEGGSAGGADQEGSSQSGRQGDDAEQGTEEGTVRSAALEQRLAAQAAAEGLEVKLGDEQNIRDTLPLLFETQHQDVLFAENRLQKPDGYGVLFANGTGTGKTFLGLGIIKRMVKSGKPNGLIVVPNDAVMNEWTRSAEKVSLEINKLESTSDKGRGVAITTYANLANNLTLADREIDFFVADEAHNLMANKDAAVTSALEIARAITLHQEGDRQRAKMKEPVLVAKLDTVAADLKALENALPKTEADSIRLRERREKMTAELIDLSNAFDAAVKREKEYIEARQGSARPRGVFLSATPFGYEKNTEWAQGYLFEYPKPIGQTRKYNDPSPRDRFMMQHFGYRMRYNKLTEPDAAVDRGIMQRQFNTWLRSERVLSTRLLEVDRDYDRKFILIDGGIGTRIDQAMTWLREAKRGLYMTFYNMVSDNFDYLARSRLLEAIKSNAAIDYIKKQHALGRKVIVFYDYNQGGGFNPFSFGISRDTVFKTVVREPETNRLKTVSVSFGDFIDDFSDEFGDIMATDFGAMKSPLETLTAAFPTAGVYNGIVNKNTRQQTIDNFNNDTKPESNLLIVQSSANAGWSGHDTTGEFQRVLINLGLPVAPTKAIQQEGRIYRIGQESDAIFRYFNTGTNWERTAFATKVARRASAAENMAMGEQARALLESFVDAFESSEELEPNADEGKGGKARDRNAANALTPMERAKSFYFGRGKKTAANKAREGKDYFATPEPIGLMMVEWLHALPNDSLLEPSAGHGAIARWFPEYASRRVIEPSLELAGQLGLVTDADQVNEDFEQHNVVNKYNGIAMNPPFGVGGKTAIEHLEKAFGHLSDGGRVVAIIPEGPAADKRFEDWLYKQDEKGRSKVPNARLAASISLPTVTFERAATKVKTRIVVIDRVDDKNAPGVESRNVDLSGYDDVNELFEAISRIDIRRVRPDPEKAATAAQEAGAPPVSVPEALGDNQQFRVIEDQSSASGYKIVTDLPEIEHTTKKGYKLVGVIIKDGVAAKKVDDRTFLKREEGGYFVRKSYIVRPDKSAGPQVLNNIRRKPRGVVNNIGRRTPLGFYSAVARFVESGKVAKAPAAQWIATLKNAPGVKAEEIEATGLTDWLKLQKGSVTKEAVLDYLNANGVQVKEVQLAELGMIAERMTAALQGTGYTALEEYYGDEVVFIEQDKDPVEYEELPENVRQIVDGIQKIYPDSPKFGVIRRPGGTNYREVLLTLPVSPLDTDAARLKQLNDLINEKIKGYDDLSVDARSAVREEIKVWREERSAIESRKRYFKSSHYDQPNILAHFRVDDRESVEPLNEQQQVDDRKRAEMLGYAEAIAQTMAKNARDSRIAGDIRRENLLAELRPLVRAGEMTSAEMMRRLDDAAFAEPGPEMAAMIREREKIMASLPPESKPRKARTLFVNEIQSDWGQEGRRKGFAQHQGIKEQRKQIEERMRLREKEIRRLSDRMTALTDSELDEFERLADERKKLQDEREKDLELDKSLYIARASTTLRGPFVTNTESWLTLSLKRIMMLAAEEGYDKVSFITGDESVKLNRQAVVKAVDSITIRREADGTYTYSAVKNGENVEAEQSVARDRVSLMFGKTGSEQLLAAADAKPGEDVTIQSNNLRVGGAGLREFYDNILPATLTKLLRKVGGRLGKVKLAPTEKIELPPKREIVGALMRYGQGEISLGDLNDELSFEVPASMVSNLDFSDPYRMSDYRSMASGVADNIIQLNKAGKTTVNPGFEITPEMRELIQTTGLPLFNLSPAPAPAFAQVPDALRADALPKLKSLEARLEAGKITEAEYRLGVQQVISRLETRNYVQAQRAKRGRRRGPEWVIAQFERQAADGTIPRDEADFVRWLIQQNPAIADDLAVSFKRGPEGGYVSGNYNPASRIITIFKGAQADEEGSGTGTHEVLHHSERMMPDEVQTGILAEWKKAWMAELKKADKERRGLLLDMLAGGLAGSESARQRVIDAFSSGKLDYDAHYPLYSPSEFWAVNGTRILNDRRMAQQSWVKRARQWLKEMIERAKSLFGLRSDAPVIRGLEAVLKGERIPGTALLAVRAGGDRAFFSGMADAAAVALDGAEDTGARTFNNISRRTRNNAIQFWGNRKEKVKTFNWYDRKLAQQYHKALKDADFGKVFATTTNILNTVSLTSIRAAELAPGILTRVEDVKQSVSVLFGPGQSRKNLQVAGDALSTGTLAGKGAYDGKIWSKDEFMKFAGANEASWALYRQGRAAIDASLNELAAAEAYSVVQDMLPSTARQEILDDVKRAHPVVFGAIYNEEKRAKRMADEAKARGDGEAEQRHLAELAEAQEARKKVEKIFGIAKSLKDGGYAPLMRFGRFGVTVTRIDPVSGRPDPGEEGDSILHFSRYESENDARAALRELRAAYGTGKDVQIVAAPISEKSNQLYAGISPETMSVFAEAIGADAAMKKYIEQVASERSALKRRLDRSGTPGYSRELPRVLSNFITSNARYASQRYFLKELDRNISRIPKKTKGDVLDEAILLKNFVLSPDDAGAKISSVMFILFLTGSAAAAFVNTTQTLTATIPYLSQYAGARGSASQAFKTAMAIALGKLQPDPVLAKAMKRANQEGIVDAQEIFHLYSVGAQGVASGLINTLAKIPGAGRAFKDGGAGARARANAALTLLGSMFSLAEKFNRKVAFVSAYEVARKNGSSDDVAYAFAVRTVNVTQGVFNKAGRSNWARPTIGRALLTFKSFSLMYMEMFYRMIKYGGPEGRKAAVMMLAILMLLAGEEGLPFMQDLNDLIDTLGQTLGYDTNTVRSKRRWAHETLGKEFGDFALYGVSSLLPLDWHGRLGLGNLIPGTGFFKLSNKENRAREVAELIGPTAGAAQQMADAWDAAADGKYGKALQSAVPKFARDILQGIEMGRKGYATDARGRVLADTDGLDAVVKMIGFQPTAVAQRQRAASPMYQDIALQKRTESAIIDEWATAVMMEDDKGINAAVKSLDDWNNKNPDTPIYVAPEQVMDRVKSMRAGRDAALLKSAPKEMRGRVADGLDAVK